MGIPAQTDDSAAGTMYRLCRLKTLGEPPCAAFRSEVEADGPLCLTSAIAKLGVFAVEPALSLVGYASIVTNQGVDE